MQKDDAAGRKAVSETTERHLQPIAKGQPASASGRGWRPGRVPPLLAGLHKAADLTPQLEKSGHILQNQWPDSTVRLHLPDKQVFQLCG